MDRPLRGPEATAYRQLKPEVSSAAAAALSLPPYSSSGTISSIGNRAPYNWRKTVITSSATVALTTMVPTCERSSNPQKARCRRRNWAGLTGQPGLQVWGTSAAVIPLTEAAKGATTGLTSTDVGGAETATDARVGWVVAGAREAGGLVEVERKGATDVVAAFPPVPAGADRPQPASPNPAAATAASNR